MFTSDGKDRVFELNDIPQCSFGAPLPIVVADERQVAVAFYREAAPDGWDGRMARTLSPSLHGCAGSSE